MLKLFAGLVLAAALLVPATARAQDPVCPNGRNCPDQSEQGDRCGTVRSGEQCGEGNGRKTDGGKGTGKVSHKGWPAITGVLFKVLESGGTHRHEGTADNDELLGHHGNDTMIGGDGKDILWGDWELAGNGSGQSDVLRGGDGNDFLYPSHGHNVMLGGPGNDRIIAYYGKGTIDCGPGKNDYAQTRLNNAYKVSNCELVRHFCAFGSKPNGDCKKPGEDALAVLSRQASQSALLARLDAW